MVQPAKQATQSRIASNMVTPMAAPLGRILIYTRKIPEMVAFYSRHFGFEMHRSEGDRIVELRPSGPGATILLHPSGKTQKQGQTLIKLVFDVADVEDFCKTAAENGLQFGSIHRVEGYCFANAKDPSGNSVSISSRAFCVSE